MNNSAVIAWEMKYPKEISRSTAYISKPEFVRSEGRAKDIAARCLALCGEPATYKPLSYIPQASVTESTQMLYAFVDEAGELELNGPYVLATEDHGQMQRLAHTREDKVVRCYTFGGNYPLAATPEAQVAPQGGGEAFWPEWVKSETLEVLRNVDTELRATGRHSGRIERLINLLAGIPTTQPAGTFDSLLEAFKTWPEDIRKKLSLHDLRRMAGWAPPTSPKDWRIDTSAGGPILVYQNCSVIEGEQARYVLRLIASDKGSQPAGTLSGEVEQVARERR